MSESTYRSQVIKRPVASSEFEQNAKLAEAELQAMMAEDPALAAAVKTLASYWKFWYLVTGHKHLGRILLQQVKP